MKYTFFLALVLPSLAFAKGGALLFEEPKAVSVGDGFSCVVAEKRIQCWGKNDFGQTNAPTMKDIKKITAGLAHSCALGAEGVKCWGKNDNGQTDVPSLKNPTDIAVGDSFSCALDEGDLKCWGRLDLPALIKDARLVAMGEYHVCLVDQEGLKCFSQLDNDDWSHPPVLTNIRALASGFERSCALSDEGVTCWGAKGSPPINVPPLKEPRAISVHSDHSCAIDAEGVKCWGSNNHYGQNNAPKLTNARLLSTSGTTVCAFADEGLKCWGKNEAGEGTPPALTNPTELSVSGTHACATENDRFYCWGKGAEFISRSYNNPMNGRRFGIRNLRSNVKETCFEYLYQGQFDNRTRRFSACYNEAAGGEGEDDQEYGHSLSDRYECQFGRKEPMYCHGRNSSALPYFPLPPQEKIKEIRAAGDQLCLKLADSASCARDGKFRSVWYERDPKMTGKFWDLAIGGDRIAIRKPNERVELFTYFEKSYHALGEDDKFLAGTGLAAGKNHTCASDKKGGIYCQGNNAFGQLDPPWMPKAWAISSYGNHSCAINSGGLACWGENSSGQAEVAGKFTESAPDPRFNLDQISQFLAIAERVSTISRAKLYAELIPFLEKELDPSKKRALEDSVSRYFALQLLFPALTSGDNKFTQETLLPALRESNRGFEQALGFSGISQVPGSETNRLIALHFLKASLDVASEFLGLEERAQLQPALRAIGQAMSNLDRIQEAKEAGLATLPTLKKLAGNPKTAFVLEGLELALQWLR